MSAHCPCKTHSPCSVCLELKCDQNAHRTSICPSCRIDDRLLRVLRKDENGRYIDPVLFKPLTTCKCGKIAIGMTDCAILSMQRNPSHLLFN